MAATMDHSSIRALGSAFPHFFAGLPRSDSGDHRGGCSLKTFEGSPHRSHASRSWLGLVLLSKQLDRRLPCLVSQAGYSGLDRDVARQIPDEATQLAGDSHTDLSDLHLAAKVELAEALGETQLGLPCDVPDELWLALWRTCCSRPMRRENEEPGRSTRIRRAGPLPERVMAPWRRELPLSAPGYRPDKP